MDVALYISGIRVDLFDDENINFIGKATELNDIGKVFLDFTQSFNIPATRNNNAIFRHYYESSIDNSINANIRIPAYIEIGTLPFRNGKVQLESVKTTNKEPESYKLTFYGSLKGLNDEFGDDTLKVLDFSEFDHTYEPFATLNGLRNPQWFNGDLMYPMISVERPWRIGTDNIYDIQTNEGALDFREFKPAIRAIKIIEAIEEHYGVSFSRDFLGRSAFQDLFMWVSKESGRMVSLGEKVLTNFNAQTNFALTDATLNLSTDVLSFTKEPGSFTKGYQVFFTVKPLAGFQDIPYQISMEVNGVQNFVASDAANMGNQSIGFTVPYVANGQPARDYEIRFFVESSSTIDFTTELRFKQSNYTFGSGGIIRNSVTAFASSPVQQAQGRVIMSQQMPDMKVKDWFSSLFKMFNLVIRPTSETSFYVDTLDAYYASGDIFDITPYVDIEEIDIQRPDLKKLINFKFNKTEAVLGANFRETNGGVNETGYGDLRAEYPIDSGEEMKIEVPFDNMLFERLVDYSDDLPDDVDPVSELMVGLAINKELSPINLKPILFYNNGIKELNTPIIYKTGSDTYTSFKDIYVIGNDNDLILNQITDTVNYGAEVSPYQYVEIPSGLYQNYWDRYVDNVYNLKQRKYLYKAILPLNILHNLSLNDRLNINDKQYRINDFQINLLDGEAKLNLFNNFYDEPFAMTQEGLNIVQIQANAGSKHYDVIIDTDYPWTATKAGLSGTTDNTWVTLNQMSGAGKTRIVLRFSPNNSGDGVTTTTARGMRIDFTTNGNTYSLQIQQDGIDYS